MTTRAETIDIAAIKCTPRELVLSWQSGTSSVYSALWLRDNDPAHRDACSGQRLISLTDLPQEPKLQAAELWPPGSVTVRWEDGKNSVFTLAWFRAVDRDLRATARPMRLPWMGQSAEKFAWCDYADWSREPAAREDWLYYAARDGLAFLRNVPIEDAAVQVVAGSFGFVRETNYGRIFDVRSVAEPNNLAYTSPGLRVHTENPYREPVPDFQLLHCLTAAGQGGDSIFVDGMAVAERLRAHDPNAFSTLCQMPVRYRFQDATVDLAADRAMIEVDAREQFRAIYYNDRAIAPLPFRGTVLRNYYAAYRQLAELIDDTDRRVTYRLQPGDLVLFDNTRVLHGRTAFSMEAAGGHSAVRHLQGCYVDADGLYSSLAVLSRRRSVHP